MNLLAKAGLALAVCAGCFLAGYLTHKPPPPDVITKVEQQTVTQEKVVTKTVREQTKAPDGTLKTITTTQVTQDKAKKADKQAAESVSPVHPDVHTRWSLGLTWTPRLDRDMYMPTGAELGRRLWDTNAWATVGFDWRTHSATLGLRWEW